jgi:hypothetical protein
LSTGYRLSLLPATGYRPPAALFSMSSKPTWFRVSVALAARALLRPQLASALLRVAWRFRSRYWWRRVPFLPLPDREYLRWRMHTAYGDHDAVPPAEDVIRYAQWSVKE